MGKKAFELKNSSGVAECPKCGNNKQFLGVSEQVAEDCCDIWVECYKCNFNPFQFNSMNCIESVMGELSPANLMMAVDEWSSLIRESK